MKKILIFSACVCLMISACKKDILKQINPNAPTFSSLATEGGIESLSLGIFEKWLAQVPNEGLINIMVIAQVQHSILGDETFCPYGNYGFRWTNQVYSIKLPNGTVEVNPNKVDQKTQLQGFNSRQAGERNAFVYEWSVNYFMIVQCNLIKYSLDNPAVTFSGDAVTKRNTLKAWAYWWKGYAYSRIGSLYLAGIINNDAATGGTSAGFVDHNAIIAEANKNFDSCAAILTTLANNASYTEVIHAITPSVFSSGTPTNDFKNGDITPAMWLRQIYTYEARNFLVNKKVKTFTAGDWSTLATLTAKGLQQNDNTFVYSLDPHLVHDLNGQFFGNGSPYTMLGDGNQFIFVSERLIQDFKTGDQRFTKGFYLAPPADWAVNIRGRGMQFGTRYYPTSIENGGLYGTNTNLGIINIAGTWDENALMAAEAKIRSGSDINGGLLLIDQVRAEQGAGLAAVAGTGLTQTQAIEELRQERRIGLFLRGLAFFDARRWGVTEPVSTGGGRDNAIVLVPADKNGTSSPLPLPCQMDYRYLDYWDVPLNELDFNAPAIGSAPVKN